MTTKARGTLNSGEIVANPVDTRKMCGGAYVAIDIDWTSGDGVTPKVYGNNTGESSKKKLITTGDTVTADSIQQLTIKSVDYLWIELEDSGTSVAVANWNVK